MSCIEQLDYCIEALQESLETKWMFTPSLAAPDVRRVAYLISELEVIHGYMDHYDMTFRRFPEVTSLLALLRHISARLSEDSLSTKVKFAIVFAEKYSIDVDISKDS